MNAPQLIMDPQPGERLQRFVGDRVRISLRLQDGLPLPSDWKARLRTTIGRVEAARAEIVAKHGGSEIFAGSAWRDITMTAVDAHTWVADIPVTEIGWFHAKAYAIDADGHQHWPDGDDVGVAVHPDFSRTGNTIYCAFVRQFSAQRSAHSSSHAVLDDQLALLDLHGYSVIPPSGKLRDLTAQIPHIVDRLGCRMLHLLPITPTPTTYARFGRFGSPYAVQDLTDIDPALVVFDKRTTGIDQFRELVYACHRRGCKVMLDVVLNHTGWGSTLQEHHPEWYVRNTDGTFHSPGAWGNTWEDLVELDHQAVALWDVLAESLLVWCRRGVDAFRCDAGYMIPTPAWQYITARVRQEFPDAIFLLEGLGGAWSATETLIGEGGLQWAYSELFQNYSPTEVASYVDHLIAVQHQSGTMVHYSETHDNDRLAKRGKTWSLLRNRLCALLSYQGAFGFTAGVEWLCTEKIDVHQNRTLHWDAQDHIVTELGTLNRLVRNHPCWFDGATLQRLSEPEDSVLVVTRLSYDGKDCILIVVNLDVDHESNVSWLDDIGFDPSAINLLTGSAPARLRNESGRIHATLPPGAVWCLSANDQPNGLSGDEYRRHRAAAAAAYRVVSRVVSAEGVGPISWLDLAGLFEADVPRFVNAVAIMDRTVAAQDLHAALQAAFGQITVPTCVVWTKGDDNRVLCVPQGHWLLVRHEGRFAVRLHNDNNKAIRLIQATQAKQQWWACFPAQAAGSAVLEVDLFDHVEPIRSPIRFLSDQPQAAHRSIEEGMVLLTNGRGSMLRMAADLGTITSKYDCVLGANLHPQVPVDRHVLIKRLRAWAVADGFITALNKSCLIDVAVTDEAQWTFVANAGDGHAVTIHVHLAFVPGCNALRLTLHRPDVPPLWGQPLAADRDVYVNLRFDLEDRSFHSETQKSDSADAHFTASTVVADDSHGVVFAPAVDRGIRIEGPQGSFHNAPEWSTTIPHPIEATRGLTAHGDAWSPGWFRIPLTPGESVSLTLDAIGGSTTPDPRCVRRLLSEETMGADPFLRQLAKAAQDYMVCRDDGYSVIAGYPWFLDWGRDTLICARGLLALGHDQEILGILRVFGRFEYKGTLPNCIHGEDASNRDTVDAPLWYGVVCEELAERLGAAAVYDQRVDASRSIRDILRGIAVGYLDGTPNGIHVDPDSQFVWSPSHFTWMDTNHPAGTPRIGYPIEIQVLWWRLLSQLARLNAPAHHEPWQALADRVATGVIKRYWLEDQGWLADHLIAPSGVSAKQAVTDTVLRSNALFAVSLGLLTGDKARRLVEAARRYLIIPGAIRSLAPLPAHPPLEVRSAAGPLLNDPANPYWGRYEGDEDTRRKPAYHNGTAWVWPFPSFCEAFAAAYDWHPDAVATARSYLSSTDRLLGAGCIGHLPEIVDGDAPHAQRGCDAQAWSVTETARVWMILQARGNAR